MLAISPEALIASLNSWPPVTMLAVMLLLAFGGLIAMARCFGAAGIYVFIAVAVIGANLQVLKVVQFSFLADPVALGTILFASTYLATDLLNEFYGPQAARRGVWIGFAAFSLWTAILIATLGFQPLTDAQAVAADMPGAAAVQGKLAALFTPMPALFVAGMAAYLISQLLDVALFDGIRRRSQGRMLWLRNTGSTAVAALVDNAVFSILAWIILAPEPLPWGVVVSTYIFGTYLFRLAAAAFDTPFMYLARPLLHRIPEADEARLAQRYA